MKALVYEGPEQLRLHERPTPTPGPSEELVKIAASGICGSDMHAYLGHDARRPAPLILGHEAAGTIVGGARDGEQVTINPLVTCGSCAACASGRENLCPSRQIISMLPREGAFAQFLTMPTSNLIAVPDGVPLIKAALTEPMAVSWHAARLGLNRMTSEPEPGALILGGGAIGLGAALALRAMGLSDIAIVEPNPMRRAYLGETCKQRAIEQPDGPYSIVVDAVGLAATRATASAHVRPGGVIVHIGLAEDTGGLDIRRMTLQEITFLGTYTYTASDFQAAAQAIFNGRLGDLDWIDTRPLTAGAKAFEDLHNSRVTAPKIVLNPWA